jgi:protein-disulfide isomerase
VIANYAEKGKVQVAFRDFPMAFHLHAREAARWANAAARVNKYRQVGDALFRTQAEWSKTGDIRRVVASVLTAAEMKTVANLVNDPSVEAAIERDVKLGVSAGVNGTPTMILTRKLQTYPIQQFISYAIMAQ